MNVGKNASGCDCNPSKKLVELLIIADSELDVSRDDALLLVVASSIARKLEDLSGEVLENRSEVNRSSSSNAVGDLHLFDVSTYAADRELKSRPC